MKCNYLCQFRDKAQTSAVIPLLTEERSPLTKDESSSADDKAKAQEKKLALIDEMENELALEYLIKGLGFSDAIVTTSSSYINVIVKSSELNSSEVAKIVSVVTENTDFTLSAIKVIPVV